MKDKLFCIKIGGNIIDNKDNLEAFLQKFAAVKGKKILVHGGGKIATQIGNQLNIKSNYVDGRRITDDETIDLVTMVYGGLINKKIVAQLQHNGANAIGLTGADANTIPANKRPVKTVDYGWVGDIDHSKINVSLLDTLLQQDIVPIYAPLTHDTEGHILNTNADTVASSLAITLSSLYDVRLVYCFEKQGILLDIDDENSVVTKMDKTRYEQLKAEGKLFEGILPKLENAFAAIQNGVQEVLIGHADQIIANTTNENIGTLIVA